MSTIGTNPDPDRNRQPHLGRKEWEEDFEDKTMATMGKTQFTAERTRQLDDLLGRSRTGDSTQAGTMGKPQITDERSKLLNEMIGRNQLEESSQPQENVLQDEQTNSQQEPQQSSRLNTQEKTDNTKVENPVLVKIGDCVHGIYQELDSIEKSIMEQMRWLHEDQLDFRKTGDQVLEELEQNRLNTEKMRLERRAQLEQQYQELSIDNLLKQAEFERLRDVSPADTNKKNINDSQVVKQSTKLSPTKHPANPSLMKSQYEEMPLDSQFIMDGDSMYTKGGNFSAAKNPHADTQHRLEESKKYTESQMNEVNRLLQMNRNDELVVGDDKDEAESIVFDEAKFDEKLENREQRINQMLKEYGIEDSEVHDQPPDQDDIPFDLNTQAPVKKTGAETLKSPKQNPDSDTLRSSTQQVDLNTQKSPRQDAGLEPQKSPIQSTELNPQKPSTQKADIDTQKSPKQGTEINAQKPSTQKAEPDTKKSSKQDAKPSTEKQTPQKKDTKSTTDKSKPKK